ncbi:MAG: hypothetical protein E7583_03745 [Ruminococcaceae bacterium]|nr:hypothetical protein [Oscillospiraceae bacterium]
MVTSKYIEKIALCLISAVLIFAVFLTFFPKGCSFAARESKSGYSTTVFGKDIICINITADSEEWQTMINNKMSKPYIECDVEIDGKLFDKVGIRPKGNSSLTSIHGDKLSFRFDFNHYIGGQTLYGLEQMVINNLQADATYMKDYIAYDLMEYMQVKAPLHTFAFVNLNGKPLGMYLAVEVYDTDYALRAFNDPSVNIYNVKTSGIEQFVKAEIDPETGRVLSTDGVTELSHFGGPGGPPPPPNGSFGMMPPPGQMPNMPDASHHDQVLTDNVPVKGSSEQDAALSEGEKVGGWLDEALQQNGNNVPPRGDVPGNNENGSGTTDKNRPVPPIADEEETPFGQGAMMPPFDGGMPPPPPGGNGGGGDLVYTDGNTENYSNIFGNAVSNDASAEEFGRVIRAIYYLNKDNVTNAELEKYWDVDAALRYLAVHAFMVNSDSYTGNMMQNYALAEQNGKITILPWDYNLSFGSFGGPGPGMSSGKGNATEQVVNHSVDEPVFVSMESRPLVNVLLSIPEYKQKYYEYLTELTSYVTGDFQTKLSIKENVIYPYILKEDSSIAFYSPDAHVKAFDVLLKFLDLRSESINNQIKDGKNASFVSVTEFSINDMGSMGGPGGMPPPGMPPMGQQGQMPPPPPGQNGDRSHMMPPPPMFGEADGNMPPPPPPPGMMSPISESVDKEIDGSAVGAALLCTLLLAAVITCVCLYKRRY